MLARWSPSRPSPRGSRFWPAIVISVGEQEAKGAGGGDGLPRLPPGRHGLDRDFVTRNQHDRLTAGMITVVAERGYGPATIGQICGAAGVSRRTFYSYFSDKEDCYLDALARFLDHLSATLREAAASAEDWPAALRARVAAMLSVFSTNPDLVHLGWIAPQRAGQALLPVYHRNVEQILDLLSEGRPAETTRSPSPLVQRAVAGGLMASIALRVEAEESPQLGELLPDLVEFFLAQYLGREEAVSAVADLIPG